jgi:hypothetical protein
MLAWEGLGNIEGLPARPYRRWYPWFLDPADPEDPTVGHRGVLQWHLSVALADGLVGLRGWPPDDERTGTQMRDDLLLYMPLERLDLRDRDGTEYQARMTSYVEEAIEEPGCGRPGVGLLAEVEFALVRV